MPHLPILIGLNDRVLIKRLCKYPTPPYKLCSRLLLEEFGYNMLALEKNTEKNTEKYSENKIKQDRSHFMKEIADIKGDISQP